jgi:opine dehydrogenase
MGTGVRVTILGGGNGAFAAAADLALRGLDVRILEDPSFAASLTPVVESGGIHLESQVPKDIPSGFARIPLATSDPALALDGADIVLYVVPAYAERPFTERILPFLNPGMLVVHFCGLLGGALEFANFLRCRGVRGMPLIGETEALIYGSFKSGPDSVLVSGRKAGLAVAALPAGRTEQVLERLRPLYPDFTAARNVLETGLRNTNPIGHVPTMVHNAGRITASSPRFRFYWDGIPESVGRVMDALDRERVLVGQALGLQLPTTRERLLAWYGGQGASGETLGKVMATNPAYESAAAPHSLSHRFLTEDVPFGIVPFEALGTTLGVATPITSALITLSSELCGTDFRSQGRNLKALGLEGLGPKEIEQRLTSPPA